MGSTNFPLFYIFLYSHHLSAKYCINNVRRNSVLVTNESKRVKMWLLKGGHNKITRKYMDSLKRYNFKKWWHCGGGGGGEGGRGGGEEVIHMEDQLYTAMASVMMYM